MDWYGCDEESGRPKDTTYLEKGLPPYLYEAIDMMQRSWEIIRMSKHGSCGKSICG